MSNITRHIKPPTGAQIESAILKVAPDRASDPRPLTEEEAAQAAYILANEIVRQAAETDSEDQRIRRELEAALGRPVTFQGSGIPGGTADSAELWRRNHIATHDEIIREAEAKWRQRIDMAAGAVTAAVAIMVGPAPSAAAIVSALAPVTELVLDFANER